MKRVLRWAADGRNRIPVGYRAPEPLTRVETIFFPNRLGNRAMCTPIVPGSIYNL